MSIAVGQRAEDLACEYLVRQGLQVVTRNYRCRLGEIDIICRDKSELVFVEVRYRKSASFGSAAESVTYFKQQKLVRTAMLYLQHYPSNLSCRFDVISIMPEPNQTVKIDWIKHAFEAQ